MNRPRTPSDEIFIATVTFYISYLSCESVLPIVQIQTCALTLARLFPRTIKNNPPPMLSKAITASSTWGAPKGKRGNQAGGSCDDWPSTTAMGGVP